MAQFAPTVPRIDSNVFLIIAHDGAGSAAIRGRELDGHLEYIEKNYQRYLVCGPLRAPGQAPLIGSYFLVLAEDEQAARALLDGDPYISSGMYENITVQEATAAGGRFMGGVIWESADAVRDRAS